MRLQRGVVNRLEAIKVIAVNLSVAVKEIVWV